jgi:hypothetical protein
MAQTSLMTKDAMERLEDAIRRYDHLAQIGTCLAAAAERGSHFRETLLAIEENVRGLQDKKLESLYVRLVNGYGNLTAGDKAILDADYAAFVMRLTKLTDNAAIQANEADIEVRQQIGLDASIGVYGPTQWKP